MSQRAAVLEMVNALIRCRDMVKVFVDADPADLPPTPETPVMLAATKELYAQICSAIYKGKKLYYEVPDK